MENTAVLFDGSSSYILTEELDNLPSGNSARTIEFWINSNSYPSGNYATLLSDGENNNSRLFAGLWLSS